MNKYENVIMLRPNLNEKELTEIISKVENKIGEFATITDKQDMGVRKLAYKIEHYEEAHYFVYQFTLNENTKKDVIKDIEFFYKITDEIMKYLTVDK